MTQKKKTVSTAPKPPKKLIPRTAPKPEVLPEALPVAEVVAPVAVQPAPTPATASAAKAAPARVAKKPAVKAAVPAPPVVSAEEKAEAAPIKQPLGKPGKAVKAAKPAKPPKAKKVKLVRDSYAMPEDEYAQIGTLKKRLAALEVDVKKSELLRGGIAALAALNDAELKAVMGRVERIKTGRPAK